MENINIKKTGLEIKFSQENSLKLKKAEENLNKYVTDLIRKKEAKLIELNTLNTQLYIEQEKRNKFKNTVDNSPGYNATSGDTLLRISDALGGNKKIIMLKNKINEVKNEINSINKMLETDRGYLEYKKIKEQILKDTARQLQNLKVEINPELQKYNLENNNENESILALENSILEQTENNLANSNEKVEEKETIA